MTRFTDGDVLSVEDAPPPQPESPRAHARARPIVEDTKRDGKVSWWQWANRSLSLQETWQLAVRANGSTPWAVPMFVLVSICPRLLTGPLVRVMTAGGTVAGEAPGDVYDGQPGRVRRVLGVLTDTVASWWVWTDRAESVSEVWTSSWGVKPERIPDWAPSSIEVPWHLSNVFERTLVWFPLILICPRFMTGPMIWLVARPTRRVGAWCVVALLSTFFSTVGG